MEKTKVYLPKEELDTLREVAARSGRSVAEIIRERSGWSLKPATSGPVAIPTRTSIDYDSVHDEP